jgi:ribose transport system substrate-binding protein
MPAYQKAGVVISDSYSDTPPAGPIISNFNGPQFSKQLGDTIANWFIADSKGAGKALLVTVDSVTGLRAFTNEFVSYVGAHCASCSVTKLPMTYTDATGGAIPGQAVAKLQQDPSLNYVILPQGTFANGLPAALAGAGLQNRVKIAGQAATVQNLADIKNGTEAAWTLSNLSIDSWYAVDAVIRHVEGMTFDPNTGAPDQLLTRDVPFGIEQSLPQPADYQAQFKKLWHVS